MDYYIPVRGKGVLTCTVINVKPEDIMLSQSQKEKYYHFQSYAVPSVAKTTETEGRMVADGERGNVAQSFSLAR